MNSSSATSTTPSLMSTSASGTTVLRDSPWPKLGKPGPHKIYFDELNFGPSNIEKKPPVKDRWLEKQLGRRGWK